MKQSEPAAMPLNLYEYAVIRYVPDIEREEFVNVGLIMMCKRRRWIKARIMLDDGRISAFSSIHPVGYVARRLEMFTAICAGVPDSGPMAELPAEERFRWLTAVKSSCIQTSRPHPGKTSDLEATFNRLLDRLVTPSGSDNGRPD